MTRALTDRLSVDAPLLPADGTLVCDAPVVVAEVVVREVVVVADVVMLLELGDDALVLVELIVWFVRDPGTTNGVGDVVDG